MRLLVTGAAGFIGSHFVRYWLAAHAGDEIVSVDLLTYAGVRANLDGLCDEARHRFVQGDICDDELVQEAMGHAEVIVHFAAETHVDRSITNAAPFLRTNVEGTHTLLRVARDQRVGRFIHISTDEVYGPILEGAHTEEAPLRPRSPYAASKAAGDLLVAAFHHTYGLSTIIVRPTNVFGPRQLPEKFIPLCLTNLLEDRPVPIYGDGQQRRAWLFVEDLCRAIERVMTSGQVGHIYHVTSPWELPNVGVAKRILEWLGKSEELLEFVQDRPGHDRRYAMEDASLRALGWTPRVTFEEGLRRTIDWYRDHPAWWQPLKARLREDPYHWLNRAVGARAPQAAHAIR